MAPWRATRTCDECNAQEAGRPPLRMPRDQRQGATTGSSTLEAVVAETMAVIVPVAGWAIVNDAPDFGYQVVRIEGLRYRALGRNFPPRLLGAESRHHKDRLEDPVLPDPAEEGAPVHYRHSKVEKDNVRPEVLKLLQSLLTIGG